MVFEDFVPVTADEALISAGDYRISELTRIERVKYVVGHDSRVHLGERLDVLAHGKHVRLGGWCEGRLVYSDEFSVIGAFAPSEGAHQPFVHEGSLYYSDEWPYVKIHKDGALYLGHFNDMVQVGNPHWAGDTMFFEARPTAAPDAPHRWEIWSKREGEQPRYHYRGANPAVFDGHLFFGQWNGRTFDYFRRPLNDG